MKKNKTEINYHLSIAKHAPYEKPFIVIDGMNIAYTTYYSYKKLSFKGKSVSIIYGFMQMIKSIITRHCWTPEKIIVVWDGERHPKRMEWLSEYKSHRETQKNRQDLVARKQFAKQIIRVRKFLHYMGICQVWNNKVEGDDMIYWVVKKYSRLSKVIIISGDKDMMQLVTNDVTLYNQRNDSLYNPRLIGAGNYGVGLDNLIDFYCLIGDTADDIPGINGIGEIRAAKFLEKFGSVRAYLNNKKFEFSGMLDKLRVKKIVRRNRRMIDLKWFNERFHTEEVITYYKGKQNPEFNETNYINFCRKYGLKTYLLPKMITWFKNLSL